MFQVLCESHGLNLLIKDLLTQIPTLAAVLKKVNLLTATFQRCKLQTARYKAWAKKNKRDASSFVLGVITR
jgi:hypothetical protein